MGQFQHGHALRGKESLTYRSWKLMVRRCYEEKYIGFHNYGGRGIRVCKRWVKSFMAFLQDMGERPSPEYTLDRLEVNGHYFKGNCKWSTRSEQAFNRRPKSDWTK